MLVPPEFPEDRLLPDDFFVPLPELLDDDELPEELLGLETRGDRLDEDEFDELPEDFLILEDRPERFELLLFLDELEFSLLDEPIREFFDELEFPLLDEPIREPCDELEFLLLDEPIRESVFRLDVCLRES